MIEVYYEYTCDGNFMFGCEQSDVSLISNMTMKELRQQLKEVGWKRIDGKDFCPECAVLYRAKKKAEK